jgi:hypothetical protein
MAASIEIMRASSGTPGAGQGGPLVVREMGPCWTSRICDTRSSIMLSLRGRDGWALHVSRDRCTCNRMERIHLQRQVACGCWLP